LHRDRDRDAYEGRNNGAMRAPRRAGHRPNTEVADLMLIKKAPPKRGLFM
jgi:hypothetical protein